MCKAHYSKKCNDLCVRSNIFYVFDQNSTIIWRKSKTKIDNEQNNITFDVLPLSYCFFFNDFFALLLAFCKGWEMVSFIALFLVFYFSFQLFFWMCARENIKLFFSYFYFIFFFLKKKFNKKHFFSCHFWKKMLIACVASRAKIIIVKPLIMIDLLRSPNLFASYIPGRSTLNSPRI